MILVFGGTSDSLKICEKLNENKIDYILSVATDYGFEISKEISKNIICSRMNEDEIINFIKENNIEIILDATHPYATMVTQNVINSASKSNITYIRYERKSSNISSESNVYKVKTNDEAIDIANKIGENIFLATGSKTLKQFANGLCSKKIVARVLPTSDVIKSCEECGLLAHNIVGMKGPFSYDINKSIYNFYGVDTLITKESGSEGGFNDKVLPALELAMNVVVILRPKIEYEKVVSDIDEIVDFVNICLGE